MSIPGSSPVAHGHHGQGNIDFDDLMRKYDTEARYRVVSGWQMRFITLLAVSMSCFHLYTSGFGLLPLQIQGAVHLSFALALTLLLYPPAQTHDKKASIPWYDFILMLLAVGSAMYLVVNHIELTTQRHHLAAGGYRNIGDTHDDLEQLAHGAGRSVVVLHEAINRLS